MIKLRPWKGSKNEFEVDVIVTGTQGRTLRKRVKAPVTGKSNAERWAKALENDLLAQLLAPEPEPERPPSPTFEEFARIFLDLCKADRLGMNTMLNYELQLRLHLVPVLGKRRIDDIRPTDITAVKTAMATKSSATLAESLKTLRCLLNRAVKERLLDKAPDFDIPRRVRKQPVAYSEQEQAALVAAAHTLGVEYVAFVLLGIDAGLRRGEILALHWSDVDLERAIITVRHNLVRNQVDVPKGRSEDEIGMTTRLMDALRALPQHGPFVLCYPTGKHFPECRAREWMLKLVRRAGLPWHGTHVLRRTCGTRIADGGGGVAAVAAHLRHKDLQTASRYIDRRGANARALKALES